MSGDFGVAESTRLFTVASANATLPLVRRIVRDLMELHPRWRDAVAAYEREQSDATADAESDAARNARVAAGLLAGEIESCVDELAQIGCVLKGFESGLVDFPALRDNRVVCLCWQYDEPSLTHWHDVDAGYAGRQPIDHHFTAAGTP